MVILQVEANKCLMNLSKETVRLEKNKSKAAQIIIRLLVETATESV